jgi:predicted nucleotidyltransferase
MSGFEKHTLRKVVYDKLTWRILHEKRAVARRVMEALSSDLPVFCYGSVARGDVNEDSDVDIVLLRNIPSYIVELALERSGLKPVCRRIVQATPHAVPKAFIYLDPEESIVVSFPLAKMTRQEEEFYRFGGMVSLDDIVEGRRVPGVNRRLNLVMPIPEGHLECSVVGREAEVARLLKVSVRIVEERVFMLKRREEIGRTGVFINYTLAEEETFEEALKKLASRIWHLRRLLRYRG